jgi:hypothetical protein
MAVHAAPVAARTAMRRMPDTSSEARATAPQGGGRRSVAEAIGLKKNNGRMLS